MAQPQERTYCHVSCCPLRLILKFEDRFGLLPEYSEPANAYLSYHWPAVISYQVSILPHSKPVITDNLKQMVWYSQKHWLCMRRTDYDSVHITVLQAAEFRATYSVAGERDSGVVQQWDSELEDQYEPLREVIIFKADRLPQILTKMKQYLAQPATS